MVRLSAGSSSSRTNGIPDTTRHLRRDIMRKMWKKSVLVLCLMLILGAFAFPVSAADTKVTGGGSRGTAATIKTDTSYYTTIKSSQTYSIFKFKTSSIRSYYLVSVSNRSVSQPISVYLRGTDKKDAGAVSNNKNIVKTNGCLFEADTKPLKTNSWYYIIIKNSNRGAGQVGFHILSAADPEGALMREAKSLKVGKNYYGTNDFVLDNDYFKFVPEATGKYRVVVKNLDNTDWIRGSLVNGSNTKLGGNSHIEKGQYMSVTTNLKKGVAYFIHVNNQNDSYNHYNYKIFIQKK